ncbi:MAG: hypothetical protein IJ574_04105 [Bacilli bacterium]|nr:hypothetical protein [Bacilli bacterium]
MTKEELNNLKYIINNASIMELETLKELIQNRLNIKNDKEWLVQHKHILGQELVSYIEDNVSRERLRTFHKNRFIYGVMLTKGIVYPNTPKVYDVIGIDVDKLISQKGVGKTQIKILEDILNKDNLSMYYKLDEEDLKDFTVTCNDNTKLDKYIALYDSLIDQVATLINMRYSVNSDYYKRLNFITQEIAKEEINLRVKEKKLKQ